MDPFDPLRFRPQVRDLEDRVTPAVTVADATSAAATVATYVPALEFLNFHQNTLSAFQQRASLQTQLPQIYFTLTAAAATLNEAATEVATDPAMAAQFGPYVGQVAAAAATASGAAAATQTLGLTFGATAASFSPPAPPSPPATNGNSSSDTSTNGLSSSLPDQTIPYTTTQSDGLKYRDEVTGTGNPVTAGSTVTVQYTGFLANGTVFDSTVPALKSTATGQPATFALANTIVGFQEGLVGMMPGGIRVVFIPSAIGYGTAGSGSSVPPNSDLIFEIKLISFTPASTTSTSTTGTSTSTTGTSTTGTSTTGTTIDGTGTGSSTSGGSTGTTDTTGSGSTSTTTGTSVGTGTNSSSSGGSSTTTGTTTTGTGTSSSGTTTTS